jgi:hypothetical protein
MLRRSAAGLTALLLLAGLPASAPRAATQGLAGTASTGEIGLIAELPRLIRISGVNDLDLGTWTGTGARTRAMPHRVCTNAPDQLFSITATGSGTGGAFELAYGPAVLAYELEYRDRNTSPWAVLQPNVALAGQRGQAPTASASFCPDSGAQPQRLRVRIRRPAFLAAPAGAYSGILALLVAPD